ncbi:hypothetical protein [Halobellus sp. H-GB7]|uniref:hypothetical protein n=1 Tax=Halobellus sp. H-GB7 TaxID=3069756 RepID=UPI0027B5757B|nr:hypothetical protein [Halobellus sp. H-GB7]MDQ2055084.1 hypothetical protein [Halobellus sp. H-GB7]
MSRDAVRGTRLAVLLVTLVVTGGLVAGAGSAVAVDAPQSEADDASLTADSDVRAATAGSTSVRLSPTTAAINESRTQTFDLVVSDADGGVGAVTATISVGDADVASIDEMELRGDPGAETIDVESDGSEVFVRAALMDTEDTGTVTIGTVTVEGTSEGSSDVDLSVESLGDESGDPYDVGTTPGGSLTVSGTADAVDLEITADASAVEAGDEVDFEVKRADSDALVSATVHLGGEVYETGLDGVATVEITESMASDAETVTAVASKESTAKETFQNDSVTLNVGPEETETSGSTDTSDGTDMPDGTDTPAPGDGPRVTLESASPSVGVGELSKLRVVATGVDGGVGAIEARISVGSGDAAQIAGVELAGDAGVAQTEVRNDGTVAVVRGAMMDTNDAGTAHVATVTLEGVAAGTTPVTVETDDLGDEQGNTYEVAPAQSTTLTVGSGGDGSGSGSGSSMVVLSVSDLPKGFEKASVTVRTGAEASVIESQAGLVSESQLRVVSDGPQSTTVQAVDLAGNVDAIDGEQTLARLTYDRALDTEDVEISVENLRNDRGAAVSGDHISVSVRAGSLFTDPLPGADAQKAPTDPDNDGRFEDIDGDGAVTFGDAVALSFVQATELRSEQVTALDFDEDGDLDTDDAVTLAFE